MRSGGTILVLNLFFEFVAGVKSYNTARLDWNGFTGSRIAAGARRLGANLEIAKT